MVPTPVAIGFQLPFEIARVDPRESRRAGAVPPALESVTGEAGVAWACLGAAQCDQAPIGCEAVERRGLSVRASGDEGRECYRQKVAHSAATNRKPSLFPALAATPLLAVAMACKGPPEDRHFLPMANPANGRAVIQRVGCGSCHNIPGINWPKGTVGPNLEGMASRGLIAGKLPNRPDVLAAYVRDAPSLVPGSGMPAMPVAPADARDIAAYLYEQEDR